MFTPRKVAQTSHFSRSHLTRSAVSCQAVELYKFLNHRFRLSTGDPLRNTGMQVVFQDNRLQLLNGLAHSIGLAQNINAVLTSIPSISYYFIIWKTNFHIKKS